MPFSLRAWCAACLILSIARVSAGQGLVDTGEDEPPTRPAVPETVAAQFNQAVSKDDQQRVKELLDAHPELARDPSNHALAGAARRGRLGIARLLIERGADVNASLGGNVWPIHFAAGRNHYEIVGLLLRSGADPNVSSKLDGTALHAAALYGYLETAAVLLDHKADPNARGPKGVTPLMNAMQGMPSTVDKLLLKSGADPDLKDDAGFTAADYADARALAQALEDNDVAKFKQALAKNRRGVAGVGRFDDPMRRAISFGRTEMAAALLEAGADPSRRDENQMTPLHQAASMGRAEIAQLLIRAGADPSAKDVTGRTPLQYTSEIMDITDAKRQIPPPDAKATRAALLEAGTNLKSRDDTGRTAAFDADPEVVREFVKRGGDINAPDDFGYTPLRSAAVNEQPELARLLIELGAKPDVITATATGDLDAVKRFVAADKSLVNFRFENPNQMDLTPLVIALKNGHRDVARFLLENGAEPNAGFPGWGLTPLQLAVERDDAELVKLLLDRGADATVEDASEEKPIDSAKSDAVRDLLQRAARQSPPR